MPTEFSPESKVYPIGDDHYSINDLLLSATQEEYLHSGMPRISDFHLKVGEPVRFRLDSGLVAVSGGADLTPELADQLILPLIPDAFRESFLANPREDMDCGFEISDDGSVYNFRVNVFRDRHGLAATIRFLPPYIPDPSTIGFRNDLVWRRLVSLKQGLVIMTGVTGSGKTTTIASIINRINQTQPVRIITLEDPIEYHFTSEQAMISQRELGHHFDTFSNGLRSCLRKNPDVIYVGEMRDAETAALAISAAETGHVVFSTLHTRDAIGAVTRLCDLFPKERSDDLTTQLSLNLRYVLSQKLLNRKGGSGRIAAMEILGNTSGVDNLIRTGKLPQLYSVMQTRQAEGMNTMEQRLQELLDEEAIDLEQAVLHANRAEFADQLRTRSE